MNDSPISSPALHCNLTVLQALPPFRLTKLIRADGKVIAYGGVPKEIGEPKYFNAATMPVIGGLKGLAERLIELQPLADVAVVRGGLIGADKAKRIRRIMHARPGAAATIEDRARSILAVDVDGVPLPRGSDKHDLEMCGAHAVRLLPEAFHRAACIVQATSSHALPGVSGARVRVWFWLSRPTLCAEIRHWLPGAKPVDRKASCVPSQFVYTASPIFESGADHLPFRLAALRGAPVVEVPPQEILMATAAVVAPGKGWTGPVTTGRIEAILRTMLQAPDGKQHDAGYWTACRLGEFVARGEITEQWMTQALLACGQRLGRDPARIAALARDGLAAGQRQVSSEFSAEKQDG